MTEELTGRALDAMVGERVMGWKPQPWPEGVEGEGVFMYGAMWTGGPNDKERRQISISVEEVPHYSSTWEGLGLVVEEMERRGWAWHMGDVGEQYAAFFVLDEEQRWSYGATAPEAVARAALKALGEGTGDA